MLLNQLFGPPPGPPKNQRNRGPTMTMEQARISLPHRRFIRHHAFNRTKLIVPDEDNHPRLREFTKFALKEWTALYIPMQVDHYGYGLENQVTVTFRHCLYGWDLYLAEFDYLSEIAHNWNGKLYSKPDDPLTFEVDIRESSIPIDAENHASDLDQHLSNLKTIYPKWF